MDVSQGRGIKNPRLTTVVILTWLGGDWGHAGIRAGWQTEPRALERETTPGWNLEHVASRSRMGQSPYPGSRGLNPPSVGPL